MSDQELRFNFTKKKLESLLPRDGVRQTYYADTTERGLMFCVTKNGDKSFGYRRKVEGVSRRIFLGKFSDLSIEQARAKAKELNLQVGAGINVFEQRRESREEMTVGELFSIYMERHASKKNRTSDDMQKMFDRSCKPLHSKKLSAVSAQFVEKFYSEVAKSSPYTANRVIQLMRSVFNRGKTWKYFTGDNPFVNIITFKESPRERFLSDEEAGKLIAAISKTTQHNIADFILLSLFTGARKGNVMSMEYAEVDWSNHLWTIPAEKFKTGKKHVIALGPAEMGILTRRRSAALERQRKTGKISPFVFPGEGAKGHVMDFKRSWKTLRKQANLEDITIHDLRRSLGAAMANANVNVALVKGALGHADIKTTLAHYAHTNKRAELDAKQLVHAKWKQSAQKVAEKDSENEAAVKVAT